MLDNADLHRSLEHLTPEQRVAFTSACLEGLVRQFGESARGSQLLPKYLLTQSVALSWRFVPVVPNDLSEVERLYKESESIIEESGDEGGGLFVAEHVLAGIWYALRAVELRSPDFGVLVATNYYEAADYAITIEDPNLSDEEILATPLVAGVLRVISEILSEVRTLSATDLDAVKEFREKVAAIYGDQISS
ncbi:hypothetical protein AB0C04_21475 [Micromonospora sp. NPDC048909]|uniref:hypothetical protein n=1 Tax=Micromonospora sp. NPDC048909 TaxID=3155643 RepID=UPI0033CBDFFA